MKRYALKLGEPLAIKLSAIEPDDDGFFIVGDSAPENEARGTVAVVHVRGALSQFKGEGGDSYEAIVERVGQALASDPKPSSVVLCISSPGGVVAGLNEAVFKIQRMGDAADVPLIAYMNELTASAAFALACACERRFTPPSGIIGSIGTISTMVSCHEADKADGLDFRIITSGARKADGHPHQPISDAAVAAESRRNAELASQFFALAGKALRKSPRALEKLEAGIFIGEEAQAAGLVNAIRTLDETIGALDRTDTAAPKSAPNTGNITDRRAKELDKTSARVSLSPQEGRTSNVRPGDVPMNLKALIAKTEASIATETDPGQLRVLQAKLGTFQAKAEMDDDGDDDGKKKKDDDDDGDDESKAAKAAKKAEEAKKAAKAAGHRAKAAEYKKKAEEAEEAAKKCEEEDEEEEASKKGEESKAALTPGAAAALASSAGQMPEMMARVAALEKDATERQRRAMVDEAKAGRKITPSEYKALIGKPISFVKDFLSMRPNAIVNVDESALEIPDVSAVAGDVPASVKSMVESAIVSLGLKGEKADQHREKQFATYRAGFAGKAVTH